MSRRDRSTINTEGVIRARKKLFVMAIVLKGDGVRDAAKKSGMGVMEAQAFHRSSEFTQMATYAWDRYVRKQLDSGGKYLFTSVAAALRKLKTMVDSKSQEVQLRAIAELRQWVSNPGKSLVLERMLTGMLDVPGEGDVTDETYPPAVARKAREMLDELRVINGGRSRRRNGV